MHLDCIVHITCCISAGGDSTWIISAEDRAKHNAQFEQLKPVNGFVTGINVLRYLKMLSVLILVLELFRSIYAWADYSEAFDS